MSQARKADRIHDRGVYPSTSAASEKDRKRKLSCDNLETGGSSENCSPEPEKQKSSNYNANEYKHKTKAIHKHPSRCESPRRRRSRSRSPVSNYTSQRNIDRNKRERDNAIRKVDNHKKDKDDDQRGNKVSSSSNRRFKEEITPHDDYKKSTSRRSRYNDKKDKNRNNFKDGDDETYEWGKPTEKKNNDETPLEKEKPNFGLSGALLEDTNKVNGVIVKYSEPPEARKPKRRWRLYPFKGETALPILHIHRQSCFLVGRDRKVVDLPVDHPSCSKQHAALQYRLVPFDREDGTVGKRVRPYLIDLESANGTFVNGTKLEPKKYYELMEKDIIKFGFSTREYVVLHENSKEDQEDDDVIKSEKD